MDHPSKPNFRAAFIKNALAFTVAASRLNGVIRIALIGSITTTKSKPKDIDLMVTISEDISIKALATQGRKLLGRQLAVGDASGADVFLANEEHEYLGRTCSYRVCHSRVACQYTQCNGSFINNVFHRIRLKKELIQFPAVELFPEVLIRKELPNDLQEALEDFRKSYYAA